MAEPATATIDRGAPPVDTEAGKKPTGAPEAQPKRFSIEGFKKLITKLKPKAALEAVTKKNITGGEDEPSGKAAEKVPQQEEPTTNTKDAKPGRQRTSNPGRVRSAVNKIFATPETPTLDGLDLRSKGDKLPKAEASVKDSTVPQPIDTQAKDDGTTPETPQPPKPAGDEADAATVAQPDTKDPVKPEKTPAERLADAKNRLQKLSPNIDLNREDVKAMLQDAAANPENLENLEDLLDVVDDRVSEVVDRVDMTPEQLANLNERELTSVLETYREISGKIDPKSPDAKKLSWKMKLLMILLAPIVIAVAGAGLAIGATEKIANSK